MAMQGINQRNFWQDLFNQFAPGPFEGWHTGGLRPRKQHLLWN